MRDLAHKLVAHEAGGDPAKVEISAVLSVCEKLRHNITALAGSAGFHALQLRALALTRRSFSGLNGVEVNGDGSLRNLESIPPEQALTAGMALVAQLLRLLTTLIGTYTTLALVHEIWPGLELQTANEEEQGEHGPTT
jgi:hypothetical protein